jgi:hypothetical protein
VNGELAAKLRGVGRPFGGVESVGGVSGAGEEEEGRPVGESVRTVLLDCTPGEGDTFLDEASEGGDSLRKRKGRKKRKRSAS